MSGFPLVVSLWDRGPYKHSARLLRGTSTYEAACGEVGKPNNPGDTVNCPGCERAVQEPTLPDLARRLLAGDAPTEAEVYAAFLRAHERVSS